MACSRRRASRRPGARWGWLLAALAALAVLCPQRALADVDVMRFEPEPVVVEEVAAGAFGVESRSAVRDGAASLAAPRFCPVALSASCSPASIQKGIDCGMDWMCGIYPCLCGSADAWGGCSCNGLEEVAPTLVWTSSDEGVVRVAQAAGSTWLVPAGPGTATVTCTASLSYHEDAAVSIAVEVGGPTAADAALFGLAALAAVAAVAAALGIRRLARGRAAKRAALQDAEGDSDER